MKAGGKKVVRNATVAPATAPTRSVSSTQRRKKSAEPGAVETPPATAVVPDDATLAAMAKALEHPAQVAILRVLATRDTCVTGDLVTTIGLAQSTVSEPSASYGRPD